MPALGMDGTLSMQMETAHENATGYVDQIEQALYAASLARKEQGGWQDAADGPWERRMEGASVTYTALRARDALLALPPGARLRD